MSRPGPGSDTGPDRPYKRLSPLTPLVRSGVLVVGVLVSTWDDILRGDLGPIAWVLLALLVAGEVFGLASWVRTKYWIEADELRVDTGVISRQSRRIRVDRLQGIDIAQPLVARIFGVAELKMDVAGGGAGEGSLAFLRLAEAQQLRETLLSRRDAVRAAPQVDGAPVPVAGPAPAGDPEQVVARLDPRTLVLSLLLSPETVWFAIAGAVLIGVLAAFGGIGGLAGVVPVLGGFALTQFRKLSAFYGFTVSTIGAGGAGDPAGGAVPSGLRVRRGLFDLDTATIALARVQGVVISEPWLWRSLGWARLDVSVAGAERSEGDGKPSASSVLPVAPLAEVLALARTVLAHLEASGPGSRADIAAVPLVGPPPQARWVAPVTRRFLAGGMGEDLIVGREGMLTRRTHVVPLARVQSLRLEQGPWQRRLDLADLHVDSPPGPVAVRIRHRRADDARSLLDRANALAREARGGSRSGPV